MYNGLMLLFLDPLKASCRENCKSRFYQSKGLPTEPEPQVPVPMEVIERLLRSAHPSEEEAVVCYKKPPSCRKCFDHEGTTSYFVHPVHGTDPPAESDEEWQMKAYTSWKDVKGNNALQVRYISCDKAASQGVRFSGESPCRDFVN